MMTLDEVAKALNMSERWLRGWLAANPVDGNGNLFYTPKGRRKDFEPDAAKRIEARLREIELCRLSSTAAKAVKSGTTAGLLGHLAAGRGFVARPEPTTKPGRRGKSPPSRADGGKVIRMAPAQS